MNVLHITPSTDGYEVVTLIANRVSKNNGLALIEKDGVQYMTGGYIINNTAEIREVLDTIPKEKIFEFVRSFKHEPLAESYYYQE